MPYTGGEQNLLDDLNEFVRQTSDLLEDEPQTSGIRPPPQIEVTETTLDTARFGFEFGPQPTTEVEPGGQPPPTPEFTCPTVTFSGIEFCCYGFTRLSEPPTFNDVLISTHAIGGFGCQDICEQDDVLPIGAILYDNEDCTGGEAPAETSITDVFVALISGVYHIIAYNLSQSFILFYGTTTDIGIPATNEVTCNGSTPNTWDNDLIQCLFGAPIDFFNAGFNGTATLGT